MPLLSRRHFARNLLSYATLGLCTTAQPSEAQAAQTATLKTQWLPGLSLRAAPPEALEWVQHDGADLRLRSRSYQEFSLWTTIDIGPQDNHGHLYLSELSWRCRTDAGIQWQGLEVCDGALRLARINRAELASGQITWPEGLPIKQNLLLRWHLQSEGEARDLRWEWLNLNWTAHHP